MPAMNKAYLFLAIAIVTEVIATSCLKASDGFSRLVREACKDHLIELVRLLLNGPHDLRMPVAVRNHPPRGNAVEDAPPVDCFEPRAFGSRDRTTSPSRTTTRRSLPATCTTSACPRRSRARS